MKTVRREEPIIRNRFTECPHCKTRNFKIKKTISVGRCRKCRDSYKIITLYLKVGGKPGSEKAGKTVHESTLPSWHVPSDSSMFASTMQDHPTFSNPSFAWTGNVHSDESETTSGQ